LKRHINYDFAEYTSRNRAFRMVGLKRNDNGSWSARKRIPDDVRDEYAALHGPRLEVKFFAPVGTTAPMAKQQFSEWLAEAARRRRLQREQEPKSPFVFTSERGAPFSTAGFARMVERAGAEAKLGFKARPASLPGTPQHPTHGALHRAIADAVQGFLARLIRASFGNFVHPLFLGDVPFYTANVFSGDKVFSSLKTKLIVGGVFYIWRSASGDGDGKLWLI
jgi:hypothetical protein